MGETPVSDAEVSPENTCSQSADKTHTQDANKTIRWGDSEQLQ